MTRHIREDYNVDVSILNFQKRGGEKILNKVIMTVFGIFVSLSLLFVTPALAAKPVDTCQYVVDGNIPYAPGHYLASQFLMPGYDVFGYNYQAHIFNGSFANAYLGRPGSGLPPYTGDDTAYLAENPTAASHWAWPFRNVQLQMKWNDAWLANKDCGPDGLLDRPSPYKGSGAWLTNHATGTYEGSIWDATGNYVINVEYLGVDYPEDLVLLQSGSSITGTSLELVGGGSPWTIDSGTVSGNSIEFEGYFNSNPSMRVHFTGSIAVDGSMSGNWGDLAPGTRIGIWATTSGAAIHPICTVSDFVKIIAPPATATKVADVWYTADESEIGQDIWGEFAIIQEEASDPCSEYGIINYMSPLKKGLGGW